MLKENLTIIGTAHVSNESVEEVKNAIYEIQPDVVGVELDFKRYQRLKNEMNGIETDDTISMKKIIKENKVGIFLASTILGYIQNKIGKDVDVKPGSEMISAIQAAEDLNLKIALLDRDINITLQRTLNTMSLWEKLKFVLGILKAFIVGDEEEIDIEELKKPDTIDEVMEYFKDESPGAYEVLVHERDAYLAQSILNIPEETVVAVVGAGHKDGIEKYLDNPETIPTHEKLTDISTSRKIPWLKIIIGSIPVIFILIFVLAFIHGINITNDLLTCLIVYFITGFIGSICSGSKIVSGIAGGLSAPITVMHPILAAGMFSALVELHYRPIRKRDIHQLGEIDTFKDLWHNNVFRILLVFIGTNLGVSIATIFILPANVFIPLFMKVFSLIC